jgi:cytoskeleton-associated protein 5
LTTKQKKPPAPEAAEASSSAGGPPAKAAPAVKKPPPTAAAKSSKPAAPTTPGALDTFKYKHTAEDAEGLAAGLIPPSIMEGLADANWKARLAACEEMQTWIEGVVEDVDAEVIVRAIAKKGWSEKNFQVRQSDL